MAANSVRIAKQGLRRKIRKSLAAMSEEQKRKESELLVKKVRASTNAIVLCILFYSFSDIPTTAAVAY